MMETQRPLLLYKLTKLQPSLKYPKLLMKYGHNFLEICNWDSYFTFLHITIVYILKSSTCEVFSSTHSWSSQSDPFLSHLYLQGGTMYWGKSPKDPSEMKSGVSFLFVPPLIPENWTQMNQWNSDYNSKTLSSKAES